MKNILRFDPPLLKIYLLELFIISFLTVVFGFLLVFFQWQDVTWLFIVLVGIIGFCGLLFFYFGLKYWGRGRFEIVNNQLLFKWKNINLVFNIQDITTKKYFAYWLIGHRRRLVIVYHFADAKQELDFFVLTNIPKQKQTTNNEIKGFYLPVNDFKLQNFNKLFSVN